MDDDPCVWDVEFDHGQTQLAVSGRHARKVKVHRRSPSAISTSNGTLPKTALAAATYALQLFVECLVKFLLFLFGGSLLPLFRHLTCFGLAVTNGSLPRGGCLPKRTAPTGALSPKLGLTPKRPIT